MPNGLYSQSVQYIFLLPNGGYPRLLPALTSLSCVFIDLGPILWLVFTKPQWSNTGINTNGIMKGNVKNTTDSVSFR